MEAATLQATLYQAFRTRAKSHPHRTLTSPTPNSFIKENGGNLLSQKDPQPPSPLSQPHSTQTTLPHLSVIVPNQRTGRSRGGGQRSESKRSGASCSRPTRLQTSSVASSPLSASWRPMNARLAPASQQRLDQCWTVHGHLRETY